MVRICVICGRFYYNQELECIDCKNQETYLIKNMEVKCGFSKFEIKGDY